MSRIFVSYARKDAEAAQCLARLLETHGNEVFWDARIDAGQRWDDRLEQELARANWVVVLWSRHSIASEWVRIEASQAGDRLLPVRLEEVRPPLAFRLRQTVDLLDWDGTETHPGLQPLIERIAGPAATRTLWQRPYAAITSASPTQIVATIAQFIVFALGLFSGVLLDITPQSESSLRLVPGGIAAISALLLLLAGMAVARWVGVRWRFRLWLALTLAATLVAVLTLPAYTRAFAAGTAEVPTGENLTLQRRVIGTEFTARAQRFVALHPERADDPVRLIQDAGGIDRVWTPASIHAQWESLTRRYVLVAVAILFALFAAAQALKSPLWRVTPRDPQPVSPDSATEQHAAGAGDTGDSRRGNNTPTPDDARARQHAATGMQDR